MSKLRRPLSTTLLLFPLAVLAISALVLVTGVHAIFITPNGSSTEISAMKLIGVNANATVYENVTVYEGLTTTTSTTTSLSTTTSSGTTTSIRWVTINQISFSTKFTTSSITTKIATIPEPSSVILGAVVASGVVGLATTTYVIGKNGMIRRLQDSLRRCEESTRNQRPPPADSLNFQVRTGTKRLGDAD